MTANQHLRDLDSSLYCEHTIPRKFRRRAIAKLLPLLHFDGYKIELKRKQAIHCLHNLVLAGLANKTVADSRGGRNPANRHRIAAWDAIVAAKLATYCRGSELSKRKSRYFATNRLLTFFRGWDAASLVNAKLKRATEEPGSPSWESLIIVTRRISDSDKRKELVPIRPEQLAADFRGVTVGDYLALVEDAIEKINRNNLRHTWEAFKLCTNLRGKQMLTARQPSVTIRMNYSKELFRCGRLYTFSDLSAQSLPKHERKRILIDGEPCVELDFACHNLRIAYHALKINPNARKDLYRASRILPKFHERVANRRRRKQVRDLVKRATNICFNAKSIKAASMAVRKFIKESPDREQLRSALFDIEQLTNSRELVDRIVQAHRKIAQLFFVESGALLQTLDGVLMLRILEAFANERKPVLGVHDSILCKATDRNFALAMMRLQYLDYFGYEPVIKQSF